MLILKLTKGMSPKNLLNSKQNITPNAFDYEQNTSIVINISVSDGINVTESVLTINILDVNENG